MTSGFITGMEDWFNIWKSVNIIYYTNRLKRKKNVIIPINAIKAFEKMQHPSIIKTFSNVRIEGSFLELIKTIYRKPTGNIIQWWKSQSSPPQIRYKARIGSHFFFFEILFFGVRYSLLIQPVVMGRFIECTSQQELWVRQDIMMS